MPAVESRAMLYWLKYVVEPGFECEVGLRGWGHVEYGKAVGLTDAV
ncbi:MAG TPA: hypothetical protein VMX97_04115 [Hyphomicrobiaceae bacterium]|nr:hypothetical protein [Hyphomicrobiaceae bacterium]